MKKIKRNGKIISFVLLLSTVATLGCGNIFAEGITVSEKSEEIEYAAYEEDFKVYMEYFDFEECYNSDTLGSDVKEMLKIVEEYINKNADYSIAELNEELGTINKVPTDISTISNDYSKYLPSSLVELNDEEVAVFNRNPTWGLVVLVQADYANKEEKKRFGSNTWATNGDAYRHALWNALGARGTSQEYMKSFATAHESGSPDYNINDIDTQMDLINNSRGRELLKTMTFPSRPSNGMTIPYIICSNIANAVENGKLVRFVANGIQYTYLLETNSATSN